MAAIPAVWPAVAMCPVVQKEIAKISAVPISRHVMAFAIVLRIEDALLDFPIGPSPVDFSRSGVIAPDPRGHWFIVAEFRRGPWSCARLAGPLIKRVRSPLDCSSS